MFSFLPSRILVFFYLALACQLSYSLPAAEQPEKPMTESEAEGKGARALFRTAGRNVKNGFKGAVEVPIAGFKGSRVSMSNVKTHYKNGNYGKMMGSAAGVVAKPVGSVVMGMSTPLTGVMAAGGAAGASLGNLDARRESRNREKSGIFNANGGGAKRLDDMNRMNARFSYDNDHLTGFFKGKKARK